MSELTNVKPLLAIYGIEINDAQVLGMTLDSRKATKNVMFIAITGAKTNGAHFVDDAIERGCSLVLIETNTPNQHGSIKIIRQVQVVQFFELTRYIGALASAFYEFPSLYLTTIGITGTNGKTSVSHLLAQLASTCNLNAACLGTNGCYSYRVGALPEKLGSSENTTPDAISLQSICASVLKQGAQLFALEASSHGLVQNRLAEFSINTAVFTNLTQDHLDYHNTIEEYALAKQRLMFQAGVEHVVVNVDDPQGTVWLNAAPPSIQRVIYSQEHSEWITTPPPHPFCLATRIEYNENGIYFVLYSSWGHSKVNLPLLGSFNISNYLAAISALLCNGLDFDEIVQASKHIRGVAGRMEVFAFARFANVIVDYAHTPDALEKALIAANQHTQGRLICVFGCGGNRDITKRPLMGAIAEQYADEVVITQDNSRDEVPQDIADDILKGLTHPNKANVELDRKTAIKQALINSQTGDVLLLAGKGHEEYLELNTVREYYNERAYIKELQDEWETKA